MVKSAASKTLTENNKILLIAYYWPPSGSVAAHRWYYMSQYLANMGYEMHVLTPKNAAYPSMGKGDQSEGLIKIKRPIWEVRRLFSKENKATDNIFFEDQKKLSFKSRLGLWLRGNVFIPDARVTWYFQIRRFVKKYVTEHQIDTLITTGPPHSIHLNGLFLKKRLNIQWIADFRDPWTAIEYHDKMPMSERAKTQHEKLELQVLTRADKVVTVSPAWAHDFENMSQRTVDVVYNGYEESLWKDNQVLKKNRFTIAHLGTLRLDRNPNVLWKILSSLHLDFAVELYGEVSAEVISAIQAHGLTDKVVLKGHVPHEEAVIAMGASHLLLLLVNKSVVNSEGRIPAKVFEYLRSGSRILLLGDVKGDAAKLLSKTGIGSAYEYDDYAGISTFMQEIMSNSERSENIVDVSEFSRQRQAERFSNIIMNKTIH